MAVCKRCGKFLSNDEIGLTRKMICREAAEFFCIDCLAEQFRWTPQLLEEKIRQFRRMGCALFTAEDSANP